MMRARAALILAFLVGFGTLPARAGEADILAVQVDRRSADTFDVHATILSKDRGDDYRADAFEVLTPEGKVIARREILHAHTDEQPFTRTIEGLKVPPGIGWIVVRAHHKPRGYGGRTMTIQLPR